MPVVAEKWQKEIVVLVFDRNSRGSFLGRLIVTKPNSV